MKQTRKLIKFLGLSPFLGYGVLQLQAYINKSKYLKAIKEEQELKDSTRPDYEFFGLNWGANSDQGLLDESDTGDFIFSLVSCEKLFSVSEMVKCYKTSISHLGNHREANLMGVLVRDAEEVYIVFTFMGKLSFLTYSDFIRQGYHK